MVKIGRYEFDIDENDKTMDNGACYQLITRKVGHGFNKISPIISKSLFKKLLKEEKIYLYKMGNRSDDGMRFINYIDYYKFDMDKLTNNVTDINVGEMEEISE